MNATATPAVITSASDAELVDEVRAGEDGAFEELFRRYRPRVHSFVQRRVRDEGRAEDLTQEAFLSALRRLRETDSRVAFRPWIYEIARNATIDHFRRSTRAEEVSVESVDALRAGDRLRLVTDQEPERRLAAKQQLELLQGAFAELSDRHGRILVMRELEGLSYREIGERMELTRPGVESTLFRARRRLENEFVELETGRRCVTVRGAMGRLAEGMDLRGDRGKVARHTVRCAACRRTARELGLRSESRAARAAAMLPLPAFLGAKGTAVVAAVVLAGGVVGVGAVGGQRSSEPAPPDARPAVEQGPALATPAPRRALPAAPAEAELPSDVSGLEPLGSAPAPRQEPQRELQPRPATPPPAPPAPVMEAPQPSGVIEQTPSKLVEEVPNRLRAVLPVPQTQVAPQLPALPAVPLPRPAPAAAAILPHPTTR